MEDLSKVLALGALVYPSVNWGSFTDLDPEVGWKVWFNHFTLNMGFPGGSVVKNLPADAENMGSIPASGRPHGEGNGNPLQYSCQGSPMDRGAWQATVRGVAEESDTT